MGEGEWSRRPCAWCGCLGWNPAGSSDGEANRLTPEPAGGYHRKPIAADDFVTYRASEHMFTNEDRVRAAVDYDPEPLVVDKLSWWTRLRRRVGDAIAGGRR